MIEASLVEATPVIRVGAWEVSLNLEIPKIPPNRLLYCAERNILQHFMLFIELEFSWTA